MARQIARQASNAGKEEHEHEDWYEQAQIEIASYVPLSDLEWLAALIDLALSSFESSVYWRQSGLSSALETAASEAT